MYRIFSFETYSFVFKIAIEVKKEDLLAIVVAMVRILIDIVEDTIVELNAN